MDLYNGMRVVAFGSFVLGVSTFSLCGMAYISNSMASQTFDSRGCEVDGFQSDYEETNYFETNSSLEANSSLDSYSIDGANWTTIEPEEVNITTTTTPSPISISIQEAFQGFQSVIFRATMVVVIVTFVQIMSAVVIIGSPIQGCRERTKIWFALNLGVNLVLLLCPVMTVMNGNEIQEKFPNCFLEMMGQIIHLDAYYVGVTIDFFVQFHALVACLLMLRFDRGREYQLVEMV